MDPAAQQTDWLGLGANLIEVGGFVWGLGATLFATWQYRLREKKERGLLEALNAYEEELKRLKSDLDECRTFDPRDWPRLTPGGTADVASSDLKSSFDRSAPYIAEAAAELCDAYVAREHLGGADIHSGALRFARLEALLRPLPPERDEALSELEAVYIFQQGQQGTFVPDGEILSAAQHDGADAALVEGFVTRLISSGRSLVLEHGQMSELLLRRARRVARKRLGDSHRLTLIARQLWAEALDVLGKHEMALQELREILPLIRSVFGPSDQRVLDVMMVQQRILKMLGDFDAANAMDHKIIRLAERIDRTQSRTAEQEQESREDMRATKEWVLRRNGEGAGKKEEG